MNLAKILDELKIRHRDRGDLEFETLGLSTSELDQAVCTFVDTQAFVDDLTDSVKVVLTNTTLNKKIDDERGVCVVENPREAFFKIHNYLAEDPAYIGEKKDTVIGEGTVISDKASVAEKNVVIGKNVVIEEFVSIKENVVIGDNCVIRAGSVIGGEGFEQKRMESGVFSLKFAGGVVIGNDVDIHQGVCIDKAIYPWDNTVIEDKCRIDNLVHVGYSAVIGKGSFIVSNSNIGARVVIGKDVWVGMSATIRNGMSIGDGSRVNMGAVVTKDVAPGQAVSGNFAVDHITFIASVKRLVSLGK